MKFKIDTDQAVDIPMPLFDLEFNAAEFLAAALLIAVENGTISFAHPRFSDTEVLAGLKSLKARGILEISTVKNDGKVTIDMHLDLEKAEAPKI